MARPGNRHMPRLGALTLALVLPMAILGACGGRSGASSAPGGRGGATGAGGASSTGGGAGAAGSGGAGSGGDRTASGGASAGGAAAGGGSSAGSGGRANTGGGAASSGGASTGGAGATGGASGASGTMDGGVADRPSVDAGSGPALGMNDVTIFAPLPSAAATPVLLQASELADDGTALVPRALFDRVVLDPSSGRALPTLDTAYARLHLIAVRFDLCDRNLPGPCASSEDGRLRLVFQPLRAGSGAGQAEDIGFHVFYSIRNDELASAVAALRELARDVPEREGFLRVSPALSGTQAQAYAAKVRAFVRRYGGEGRLVRLTMNAQNLNAAAFVWLLRGVEKKGGAFVDIPVAGSTDIRQSVTLTGTSGFSITPMTDTPPGLLAAITPTRFDAADIPTRRTYLGALAAADNPLTHTAETVACAACHVSTVVMRARTSSGIDVATVPGRYTSTFNLSTEGGKSAENAMTLRALGYVGTTPLVSQRVVNETAQLLTELEARFPAR